MSAGSHERRRIKAERKRAYKLQLDEQFQSMAPSRDAPQVKSDWRDLMADNASEAVLLVMQMKLAELQRAPFVQVPHVAEEVVEEVSPPDIPEDWQEMKVGDLKALAKTLDPEFQIVGSKKADAAAVVEAALAKEISDELG